MNLYRELTVRICLTESATKHEENDVYCNTVQTQDIQNHSSIESVQLILTFETTHILK